MNSVNALQKVLLVAGQIKLREQAKLAHMQKALSTLALEAAALKASRNAAIPESGEDFAATARWQDWANARRNQLGQLQAARSAEVAVQRKAAGESCARVDVLEGLLKKAKARALLEERRRAENNGQPIER